MKQSFRTRLKQLWVPKVFRLPEPEFTKDQVDLLEDLIQLIHPTLSMAETATKDDRVQMAHFLVDIGTGIWRIRRKIEGLGRMPKEIRDALYSLESTWMSMSEGGVEIVDHIGTIPSKDEAKVVEVRDIPNLAREQVVDAIKPTILLKGEIIQLGEVIMGRPAKGDAPQAAPAESVEPRSAFAPQENPAADASVGDAALGIPLPDEADEEETPISHEVETLTMELPLRGELPAEEALPAEEEAQETEAELFVADEAVVTEPEPIEAIESEISVELVSMIAEEENAELPVESAEAEEPFVPNEPDEIPEETGFVRDVPTPFEQAIAQEESAEMEEPKKKRKATKKAKPEKEKKASEESEDTPEETPKPKKRRGAKKTAAVAEVDNDG